MDLAPPTTDANPTSAPPPAVPAFLRPAQALPRREAPKPPPAITDDEAARIQHEKEQAEVDARKTTLRVSRAEKIALALRKIEAETSAREETIPITDAVFLALMRRVAQGDDITAVAKEFCLDPLELGQFMRNLSEENERIRQEAKVACANCIGSRAMEEVETLRQKTANMTAADKAVEVSISKAVIAQLNLRASLLDRENWHVSAAQPEAKASAELVITVPEGTFDAPAAPAIAPAQPTDAK